MNFKNGQLITTTDILDNELYYDSPILEGNYPSFRALIEVKTVGGTGIQFSSGEAITANHYKYQVGEKFIMTFFPNKNNLHFKSDNIGDSFVITI